MPSVGCKTMGGFEPVPGGSTAKINQDRGVAIYPFADLENCGMFGVYDGHGRAGEKVSEFVLQHLPAVLAAQGEALWSDVGGTLKDAYVQVDSDLANEMDASVSGTTAVTCLIKDNHCWLANSGDSRAIVMRKSANGLKAVDLTSDHKPDSPGEMKRILSMGGHITPVRCRPLPCRRCLAAASLPPPRARATVPLRALPLPLPVPRRPLLLTWMALCARSSMAQAGANGSPARVWHNLRGLAMARSIGDHAAATVGVISEPEITEYDIVEDDFAIIIATDGVWELLSSQQVADICHGVKSGDVQEMTEVVAEQASYMWKVEEGDYRDDITLIIIKLPWLGSAE
jgi:serine/threonine protein phosphatase PrpC